MKEQGPVEPVNAPLEGIDQLASLSLAFAVAFFLAALMGAGLSEYLRWRGWSWTWSLCSLPAAVLAGGATTASPLAGSALAGAAAFCLGSPAGLIGWGLRRRVDDRRAGGDRELRARERRGVFDRVRGRWHERRLSRGDQMGKSIALGRSDRGEIALVRRGTRQSGSHALIPGATGAGKTTSLASLVIEYVVRSGFGAVVIEAKKDEHLRFAAQAAAAARGVPFRLISPNGDHVYDPIAEGTVDERAERLIAVQPFGSADADFYRQASSPFLRMVVRALDKSPEPATLSTVAENCNADLLKENVADLKDDELLTEIIAYVKNLGADEARAIGGLRARLFNLANSDFAEKWLDPTDPAGEVINLRRSVREREVLYFRLDTDRTGNVGKDIGQMAMLDLGAAASSMMGAGAGTVVAIDEFGAIEADALDRLYTRGRSAGMSILTGTQTIADLREAGPATLERVGATIESLVCHRLNDQEEAERIAQLIGTVPTWNTTTRTDGLGLTKDEGTRTRGHRFEVNPSELQRLGRGQAFVARLDSPARRRATRVSVVPPWERLPGMNGRS